ncbi:MAG: hypothetical protein AAGD13_24635 [Pseudomonadota bacterium]
MVKMIECGLYVSLAAVLAATLIFGAPACAGWTVVAITLAQAVCIAVR